MAKTTLYGNHLSRNTAIPRGNFPFEKDELMWKYDENGEKDLEKVGTIDTYLAIQAEAESCDVKTIVRRAEMGEVDLLNKFSGSFVDTTSMPTSLMEAQNLVLRAEHEFNNLPVDLKELFNNDKMQFLAEYGTEKFNKKLNYLSEKKKPKEIKKEEIKKQEETE